MSAPIRKTLRLLSGINLSYLEWGKGHVPLLLLHGMADHGGVWQSLAQQLGESYHIIAPDLRGHGESSKPAEQYRFADIIADLTALMDAHGWTSANVLGHSWSGKLLVVWAQQQPHRFDRLILVDPAIMTALPRWTKVLFPLLYKALPFLRMVGPFEDFGEAQAQAQQLKQYKEWTPLQHDVFRASVEEKANGQWGSKFTLSARDVMFEEVLQTKGFTQPIEIPTLFIPATEGINTSERSIKPYRQFIQPLTIIPMECHHWPFLANPTKFNAIVSHFLADTESTQPISRRTSM